MAEIFVPDVTLEQVKIEAKPGGVRIVFLDRRGVKAEQQTVIFTDLRNSVQSNPHLSKILNLIELMWGNHIYTLDDLIEEVTVEKLRSIKNISSIIIDSLNKILLDQYNLQLKHS